MHIRNDALAYLLIIRAINTTSRLPKTIQHNVTRATAHDVIRPYGSINQEVPILRSEKQRILNKLQTYRYLVQQLTKTLMREQYSLVRTRIGQQTQATLAISKSPIKW